MENGKIKERLKNKKSVKGFFAIMIAAVLLFSVVPAITFATNTDTDTTNADNQISVTKAKAASVKVTWNGNGGKIGSKKTTVSSVKKGAKIGKLPKTPKLAGYTFNGWYTKKTGGKKITKNTKVNKKVTYHAQWTLSDPNLMKWMKTGKYYVEYVMFSYDKGNLITESDAKSGADGTKDAIHMRMKKPTDSKMRIITRGGFVYTIMDTQKMFYKTPISKVNNAGSKSDYSKMVRVGTGTGTIAPMTKYAKKLPYIEYKIGNDKMRYYMIVNKVYGTEYISGTMVSYMIYTKEAAAAPSTLFDLNVQGYTEYSY